MPILILILLALLVGTLGFWDTIGAIMGAVAVVALFWILLIVTACLVVFWLLRRIF